MAFAAALGRPDLIGDGVTGAFECTPHVPTGDRAVRAPAFAEGEEFLGLGHAPLAVDDGGGFSGDGLIRDGFEERFVGGTRFFNLESESGSLVDQTFEPLVPFGEALHGCGEVEGKRWGSHGFSRRAPTPRCRTAATRARGGSCPP